MTRRHLITLLMAFTVGTVSLLADTDTLLIYKYEIRKEIAAPVWRTTQKSISEAKELNADYLLIHMNTYGGQVDLADSIRTALLNFNKPVIVFIDNQAISAGALISIAADSIYMRPGGSIGAATVVNQTGAQVPDKYQSFMRGMMRSTAESHGKKPVVSNGDTTWVWHRDPAIAESMVDPKVFVAGVSDTGSVLTLTTMEAIELGFCEGEASTIEEVLAAAGIENYTIKEFRPSSTEKLIQLLISPVVSGLLIMVIIGGIYFELQSPGVGFPLIAALTAAILYFAPLYLEGVAANWQAIVFIAGVILLAVELFVIPGFGVAGVAGITAIIAGLTFGMIDKIVFRFGSTEEGVREIVTAFTIVMISMIASFIISIWGSSKLFSSNRFLGKLALHKTQQVNEGYVGVDSGRQHSLKGATGKAHTVLRPSGKVIIDNEIYDAVAEIGFIDKGDEIKVLHDEAGQLHVIKIS
jgi:membrane-bound serine protease (ClpP class)